MRRALLLMGHGSRDAEGAGEFLDLAAAVRRRAGGLVVAGVLEFAGPVAPSIQEAVDACVSAGAAEVVAQPVLLARGHHEVHDMPAQVAEAAARHPRIRFTLGRCLGVDDRLVDVVLDRVAAGCGRGATAGPGACLTGMGEGAASRDTGRTTAVLLCGRGSLRPEANAELAAVARRTARALGGAAGAVGWCFISLADPSLPEALRRCVAPGVRRVVVVPYFLNTGVLVRRIAAQAAEAAAALGEVRVVVTPHLGVDRRVVDVILARGAEAAQALTAAWPPRDHPPADAGGPRLGRRARRGASAPPYATVLPPAPPADPVPAALLPDVPAGVPADLVLPSAPPADPVPAALLPDVPPGVPPDLALPAAPLSGTPAPATGP